MSGSLAAQIVIPIVAFLAVVGWASLVLYAGFHPGWKHKSPPPRSEVAGGSFLATDGGRQLMPIPGELPLEIPLQRAAAGEESYQTADLGAPGAGHDDARPEDAGQQADESRRAGIGLPPQLGLPDQPQDDARARWPPEDHHQSSSTAGIPGAHVPATPSTVIDSRRSEFSRPLRPYSAVLCG
jgi:hypothetical protein